MPVKVGCITSAIASTLFTFVIGASLIDCGLSALAIAVIAVGLACILGAIFGGAAYVLSRPNTEVIMAQSPAKQAAPQEAAV